MLDKIWIDSTYILSEQSDILLIKIVYQLNWRERERERERERPYCLFSGGDDDDI